MTVYKAGNSQTTYVNRIADQLRCVCEARGDHAVFVDGIGPFCIIIDREALKIQLEDVGVNSSNIEAIWLEADCIPIKNGSVLTSGGHRYKAKGSPLVLHDGWVSVKLKKTCDC